MRLKSFATRAAPRSAPGLRELPTVGVPFTIAIDGPSPPVGPAETRATEGPAAFPIVTQPAAATRTTSNAPTRTPRIARSSHTSRPSAGRESRLGSTSQLRSAREPDPPPYLGRRVRRLVPPDPRRLRRGHGGGRRSRSGASRNKGRHADGRALPRT